MPTLPTTGAHRTGFDSVAEYMASPAACGHRLGALRFFGTRADGGLVCPDCERLYPWKTPLYTPTPTTGD